MSYNFDILPYSIDVISNHISLITNTPFDQLRHKTQIQYLNNYIRGYNTPPSNNDLVIIIEYNYIEKHYLQDYADYFARCLHEYPRKCSRIHVFKNKHLFKSLNKAAFEKILQHADMKEIKILCSSYLGNIVIRPIPSTVLATVCLKPYSSLQKALITRNYDVSLYGINLNVETVAFQEQDRILSACSTSALWSLYNAHKCMNLNAIPSPNSITAEGLMSDNAKSLEGPGLSTAMICRSMYKNGFSPKSIFLEKDGPSYQSLKEHAYAYCSSNIPLILGVEVYHKKEKDVLVEVGLHALTILGFGLEENENNNNYETDSISIKLKSNKINKLFVHDDRIGPFAQLEFIDGKLKMKLSPTSDELYIPKCLTFGVYHKIRIPYINIKKTCITLSNRIIIGINLRVRNTNGANNLKNLVNNFVWDIKLKNIRNLKAEILKAKRDLPNKITLLTSPLPRHIWSATAKYNETPLFEMLFDATDIPQGNVFIDVIHHHPVGQELFDILKADTKAKYASIALRGRFSGLPTEDYFGGIANYFLQPILHSEKLDDLFGELKIPKYFKSNEIAGDAIKNQKAVTLFSQYDYQKNLLNTKIKYIWAINKDGGLLLGHEETNKNSDYKGHITLTQGHPARIAGELYYYKNKWFLNSKSGRYSVDYTQFQCAIFLENVMKQRFNIIFPKASFVINNK
jgi:hypothetical protein